MTDRKKSPLDLSSDARAEQLFRQDEERAVSGLVLSSAETDPSADRSLAITELALRDPARFIELVNYLPHAIQDMFYQYYFLGRTQEQIGKLIGCGQTRVWQSLKLGREAMCAVIYFGQPPSVSLICGEVMTPRELKLKAAWDSCLAYHVREENKEELAIKTPRNLGEFVVSTVDDELNEFFAPMTTDGPICREATS